MFFVNAEIPEKWLRMRRGLLALSVIVRENRTDLKKVNGRGSAKLLHTNSIASLGGLMHKYTKQSS